MYTEEHARNEIACALCRLSSTKSIEDKKKLSDQGASEVLTSIAQVTTRRDTQQQCSLALGYLSDTTKVNSGVVGSLLMLSLAQDEDLAGGDLRLGSSAKSAKGLSFAPEAPPVGALQSSKSFFGMSRATVRMLSPAKDETSAVTGGSRFQTMIREGLRAASSGQISVASQRSHNNVDISIQEASQRKLLTQAEMDMLSVDYTPYSYRVIVSTVKPEIAGKANKVVSFPNSSLPRASSNLSVNLAARFTGIIHSRFVESLIIPSTHIYNSYIHRIYTCHIHNLCIKPMHTSYIPPFNIYTCTIYRAPSRAYQNRCPTEGHDPRIRGYGDERPKR